MFSFRQIHRRRRKDRRDGAEKNSNQDTTIQLNRLQWLSGPALGRVQALDSGSRKIVLTDSLTTGTSCDVKSFISAVAVISLVRQIKIVDAIRVMVQATP